MWIFSGEWSILDNFAQTPVELNLGRGKLLYPSTEHAFQAAKARFARDHHKVRRAQNPASAKYLGRQIPLRDDWEEVKFDVMWSCLCAKWEQHPEFRRVLRLTGSRLIYEGNTWGDRVWGVTQEGPIWCGRNALGEMLMELRDEPV
jgi:ribA/ribD-fused uncharacterized protein